MAICSGLVHIMGKTHGFLRSCSTDDISLCWSLTAVVDMSERTYHTYGWELARLSSEESLAHMVKSDLKNWRFDFQRSFLTSSRAGSRNSAVVVGCGEDNVVPYAGLIVVLIMQHSPLPTTLGSPELVNCFSSWPHFIAVIPQDRQYLIECGFCCMLDEFHVFISKKQFDSN